MTRPGSDFWEQPEQVERFAAREPDLRLRRLIEDYPAPAAVRALDLGCAAGRNTLLLAGRGFDVVALDSSRAMVARTRSRLAEVLGEQEAARRVREGGMDRLDWAGTGSFDLLVALGVYHCAQSGEEWDRALAESARVLKRGGRLLASVFAPGTDLTGQGMRRVKGHLYESVPEGELFHLVDAETFDAEMRRHGLSPLAPAETVVREEGSGRRVTANGIYEKV
jgi:SAM-dependent methyltransferase